LDSGGVRTHSTVRVRLFGLRNGNESGDPLKEQLSGKPLSVDLL
jgi:hypothetical protein